MLPIAAVALTGLDANRWTTGGWADVARAVLHGGAAGGVAGAGDHHRRHAGRGGHAQRLHHVAIRALPAVLAEDGFLPRVLGAAQRRTGAPWVSILACSVVWALCLGLSFVKLILLDVLLTGLSILLEFAALVALRIREPELPRPYRVPGGLAGAIALGIPPLVLLVLTAVRNEAEPVGPINALEFGALLIAAGVVAYFLGDRFRKGKRFMIIADLSQIAGRTYPARRRTQNLVGGASPIQADQLLHGPRHAGAERRPGALAQPGAGRDLLHRGRRGRNVPGRGDAAAVTPDRRSTFRPACFTS